MLIQTRTTRRLTPLAALAAIALAATGCANEEAGADAPASGTIEVTAVDYAFADLPRTIEAGSSFELVNASDAELHELVAVRLPDDEQRPVEELVQLPMEELEPLFAGLQTVILAPPGDGAEQAVVVGDGTVTEPGRYAFLCFIPTGADPAEYLAAAAEGGDGPPQVDGGPPHIAQGMWAEVEVVAP